MTSSPPVAPKGLAAWQASILHFLSDPGEGDAPASYEYYDRGLLVVEDGLVRALGPAHELAASLPLGTVVHEFEDALIVPGFVDTHTHFVQTDIVASPGRQLLDWLEHYTFPEEERFASAEHALAVAEFYLDELLRHGTTSAMVMGSVHRVSVEAFFEAALRRNLRMIAGKMLMDRNCPSTLQDTPDAGYRDTAALIERWSGTGRLDVAITPRFAITSSPLQLQRAGELARAYPRAPIQTHLAENRAEIAWVQKLFPERSSYLDVYDHYGLVREGAVFAHCLHLADEERALMAAKGAAVAFCPTSNLFLGSGLYDLRGSDTAGLKSGLATDIGGGTHFGMLPTLGSAYGVTQLRGGYLSPLRAFYLATLGGARAMGIEGSIGNFATGKEADFVVLDRKATPLLERRQARASTLAERLFPFMVFGDDRAVRQTVIMGEIRSERGAVANS